MSRRIDIQPDDVLELVGEPRVGRELEAVDLMGSQPVRAPDPLHRADADPAGPRPPDVLLRAVAVRHDRLEPSTIGGGHVDLDPLAHAPPYHRPLRLGNLS